MEALEFIVLALAVHRLTRLFVEDTFPLLARPRQWVVDRTPEGSLAYLVNCFWCASVWVSVLAVAACYYWGPERWGADLDPWLVLPIGVLGLSSAASAFQTALEVWDAKVIGGGE